MLLRLLLAFTCCVVKSSQATGQTAGRGVVFETVVDPIMIEKVAAELNQQRLRVEYESKNTQSVFQLDALLGRPSTALHKLIATHVLDAYHVFHAQQLEEATRPLDGPQHKRPSELVIAEVPAASSPAEEEPEEQLEQGAQPVDGSVHTPLKLAAVAASASSPEEQEEATQQLDEEAAQHVVHDGPAAALEPEELYTTDGPAAALEPEELYTTDGPAAALEPEELYTTDGAAGTSVDEPSADNPTNPIPAPGDAPPANDATNNSAPALPAMESAAVVAVVQPESYYLEAWGTAFTEEHSTSWHNHGSHDSKTISGILIVELPANVHTETQFVHMPNKSHEWHDHLQLHHRDGSIFIPASLVHGDGQPDNAFSFIAPAPTVQHRPRAPGVGTVAKHPNSQGQLLLFPSYVTHANTPFVPKRHQGPGSNKKSDFEGLRRIGIAFDIVPIHTEPDDSRVAHSAANKYFSNPQCHPFPFRQVSFPSYPFIKH